MSTYGAALRICGCILIVTICAYGSQLTIPNSDLPRNISLPLFRPHDTTFHCAVEASHLLPLDAQADAWFREARALEDPSIYVDDRDYGKIVTLTRQSAERHHWKAMLNLATLYLEGRDPKRGVADALQLVEDAIRMGVPAAYDRMGTYYMNGTGVEQNATKAYSLWYKAAQLGNPDALAYLSEKMDRATDSDSSWSNIPIAKKMMECALGQGFGNIASDLFYLHDAPRDATGTIVGDPTPQHKMRAMQTLHQGVKLGCANCARRLWFEFDHPENLALMFVPYIDKARAARYFVLIKALGFNPFRRFPNLDKILPLPPAELPPWDGTRESLLSAAMGVTVAVSPPTAELKPLPGRYYLDPAYRLRKTDERTDALRAPFAGYWQANMADRSADLSGQIAHRHPGLYKKDELFDALLVPAAEGMGRKAIPNVTWQYHRTILADPAAVAPQGVRLLVREVPPVNPPVHCTSDQLSPVAGIWQPWVPDEHPLQSIVSQPWRQTWLKAGQSFPQPQRDWLLDLPANDVSWHLMEKATDIGAHHLAETAITRAK